MNKSLLTILLLLVQGVSLPTLAPLPTVIPDSGSTTQQEQAIELPEAAPADRENGSNSWLPFVAALLIFLLAVTGMSIGVLVRNRELKGSCGGLASMTGQDGHSACDLCAIPRDQCREPEVRARLAANSEGGALPKGEVLAENERSGAD